MQAERNASEYMSHFWTSDDPKFLDFEWSYDLSSLQLISFPEGVGFRGKSAEECRTAANLFGQCIVDCILSLESYAHWIAEKQSRIENNDYRLTEEVRHLVAFAKYRESSWGALNWQARKTREVLEELTTIAPVDHAVQIGGEVAEAFALALAAFLHVHSADPLLVRLCSFVIADEAVHRDDYSTDLDATSAFEQSRATLAGAASRLCEAIVADCLSKFEWIDDHAATSFLFRFLPDITRRLDKIGVPRSNLSQRLLDLESSDHVDSQDIVRRIAEDATQFLSQFPKTARPNPPGALALEWLAAGLRSAPELFGLERSSTTPS